jgi:hypothetical protein
MYIVQCTYVRQKFVNLADSLNMPFPRAGIFKGLWVLETEDEDGYRTGPPGYTGWRNSFLGIDSRAQYTFKNTGSDA